MRIIEEKLQAIEPVEVLIPDLSRGAAPTGGQRLPRLSSPVNPYSCRQRKQSL